MVSKSCIKYPLCVEWTTELPFENIPRRSPNMFWKGLEWNFQLTCKEERYYLKMLAKKNWALLRHVFVTTFVHDSFNGKPPKLIEYGRQLFPIYENGLLIITRNEIIADIPNIFQIGMLTMTCVFHFTDAHLDKTHVSTQTSSNTIDPQSLSRDFSTCRKNETFSDVKLICADRTFSANRFVLAARSNVFAAMFRNKMAEAETGVVHIKDVDPDVLELLLEYVYSAKRPDLCEDTAHRLYEAADKYAVHGLRRACSDWMVEFQTTDNCLDLLVLADEHSDENFKEAVACFVAEHLTDFSVESWSTFRNNYPLLALPVLEKRCEDSMSAQPKEQDTHFRQQACDAVVQTTKLQLKNLQYH